MRVNSGTLFSQGADTLQPPRIRTSLLPQGLSPWQGLTAANQAQKEKLILAKKQTIGTKDLCEGLPWGLAAYFDHVRSRGFDDKPQHAYLHKIFCALFSRQGFDHDHVFDWTIFDDYLMKKGLAERAEKSCTHLLFERRPRRNELTSDKGGSGGGTIRTLQSQ